MITQVLTVIFETVYLPDIHTSMSTCVPYMYIHLCPPVCHTYISVRTACLCVTHTFLPTQPACLSCIHCLHNLSVCHTYISVRRACLSFIHLCSQRTHLHSFTVYTRTHTFTHIYPHTELYSTHAHARTQTSSAPETTE